MGITGRPCRQANGMTMTLRLYFALTLMLGLIGAVTLTRAEPGPSHPGAMTRPQGPCDIYGAAGDPCVAAHSTTRALYASYNGPLYQVLRQSDGKTRNIGAVAATAHDAGGYADA